MVELENCDLNDELWKTRMRILSLKRMNSLLLLRRGGVRDGTRVAECAARCMELPHICHCLRPNTRY